MRTRLVVIGLPGAGEQAVTIGWADFSGIDCADDEGRITNSVWGCGAGAGSVGSGFCGGG